MKYFIDTEFLTGFHKPLFGKRRHYIDLVSIGVVAEDGRHYYAISTDFNKKDANAWVQENVLEHLDTPFFSGFSLTDKVIYNTTLRKNAYKTNKQIAFELFRFIHQHVIHQYDDKISFAEEIVKSAYEQGAQPHEFYGYFADYDYVVFSALFGEMQNYPVGFPMYFRDLKQMMDDTQQHILRDALGIASDYNAFFESTVNENGMVVNLNSFSFERHPKFPTQPVGHNALWDAIWNNHLYNFLQMINNGK